MIAECFFLDLLFFFSFSRFFTVSSFLPLYSNQYSISDLKPREPTPITYVLFSMILFFSFHLDKEDFLHNHLLLFAFVMVFPKHLSQMKMLTSFTYHSNSYCVFSVLSLSFFLSIYSLLESHLNFQFFGKGTFFFSKLDKLPQY